MRTAVGKWHEELNTICYIKEVVVDLRETVSAFVRVLFRQFFLLRAAYLNSLVMCAHNKRKVCLPLPEKVFVFLFYGTCFKDPILPI